MSASKQGKTVDKKTGTVLKSLMDMGSLFEFGGEISAAAGVPSLLGSAETMEYKIVHWDTGAGANQVFEIDYYEVYIPRV